MVAELETLKSSQPSIGINWREQLMTESFQTDNGSQNGSKRRTFLRAFFWYFKNKL